MIRAYGTTHPGRVRQTNEDAFALDAESCCYVVCDGLGGHAAGEVASRMATEFVTSHLRSNAGLLEDARASEGGRFAVQVLMDEAINQASRRLFESACRDEALAGMATTITAALIWNGRFVVGHVGDCRVYLRRGARLAKLTSDHTLAAARREQGVPEEEVGPEHVLTRAVGAQPSVLVDTLCLPIMPGDVYLLCTDGLHRYFEDDELAVMMGSVEVDQLAAVLVEAACGRGGEDNLTAVVLGVMEDEVSDELALRAARSARRLESVAGVFAFQGLSLPRLALVMDVMTTRRFSPGEAVVREGDALEGVHVLVDGQLRGERTGSVRGFGAGALVRESIAAETVVADTESELLVLSRRAFAKLVARHPRLANRILWRLLEADEG